MNTAKETQDLNAYDIRIDQNFNEHNVLFVVFDQSYITYVVPGALPGLAVGQSGGENRNYPSYAPALGYTHISAPTLSNDLNVGFGHSDKDQRSIYATTTGIPAEFGIAGVPQNSGNGGLPAIDVSGLANLGVVSDRPTIQMVQDVEAIDNVTKTFASHTFKAGVQVDQLKGDSLQPRASKGVFGFSGKYSDIPNKSSGLNGIDDFLVLSEPVSLGGSRPNIEADVTSSYEVKVYLIRTGEATSLSTFSDVPLKTGPGWYRGICTCTPHTVIGLVLASLGPKCHVFSTRRWGRSQPENWTSLRSAITTLSRNTTRCASYSLTSIRFCSLPRVR